MILKNIYHLLYNLKESFYRHYNKWLFSHKGIRFGKGLKVSNRVFITGARGNIQIGKNFTFVSDNRVNPLCRNIQGCIHTGNPSSSIIIGDNVGITAASIWVDNALNIGNNVNIGANCIIMDTDAHPLDYKARRGIGGGGQFCPQLTD